MRVTVFMRVCVGSGNRECQGVMSHPLAGKSRLRWIFAVRARRIQSHRPLFGSLCHEQAAGAAFPGG